MEKEKLNVVLTADENYVHHFATACVSLLKNNRSIISRIFLVHDMKNCDYLKQYIKFFKDKYNILIEQYSLKDEVFDKFHISRQISKATYFRLMLAEILPQDIKKVLYLDCDIVVDGSLTEILNLEFNDKYLFALDEMSVSNTHHHAHLIHLGFNGEKYLNAGVLYINLEKFRENNISKKLMQIALKYNEKLYWHDQDVLNLAFEGKWGELEYKYNCHKIQIHSKNLKKVDSPIIIHYTTSSKPWNFYDKNPHKYVYWKYRKIFSSMKKKYTNKYDIFTKINEKNNFIDFYENELKKIDKIVLYPAGSITKTIINSLPKELLGKIIISDSNTKKHNTFLNGVKIDNFQNILKSFKNIKVAITTFSYEEEITQELAQYIEKNQIMPLKDILKKLDWFLMLKKLRLNLSNDFKKIVEKNEKNIYKAYKQIQEKKSKYFFEKYVLAKLSANKSYIDDIFNSNQFFIPPFKLKKDDVIATFNTRNISDFKHYKYIYIFEKNKNKYDNLISFMIKKNIKNISILNKNINEKDIILPPTYIEINSSQPLKKLKNISNIILNHKPKVKIISHHSHKDIFNILNFMLQLNPNYKAYFRINKDCNLDSFLMYFN